MTNTPDSDTERRPFVDETEHAPGLNLLQIFVLFALILGSVLFGMRKLDALRDPVAEVDRLYAGVAGVAVDAELPTALARSAVPQLSEVARLRLAELPAPRVLSGAVLLEDTTLKGVFLVEDGAQIVLRNLSLEGSLIARAGVEGRAPAASRVVLEGDVSLLPGDAFPGLSVWLPGGSLTATDPASNLLVDGDIVAQRIELLGHGDVIGELHAVEATRLSADVRVRPRVFDAVVLPEPAEPDVSALLDFEFPR